MGKRSDFERRKNDAYQSPRGVEYPLLQHLAGVKTFAEPCAGDGQLIQYLEEDGLECVYRGDIISGQDALTEPFDENARFDAIITNPPWTRAILHPMIERFQTMAPTWLLFDAAWAFTGQAAPFLDQCSHIVTIGRVKWIPDSPFMGKDDSAWYRFHSQHTGGPRFYGKQRAAA